jgi:hypothetical protein
VGSTMSVGSNRRSVAGVLLTTFLSEPKLARAKTTKTIAKLSTLFSQFIPENRCGEPLFKTRALLSLEHCDI